MFPLPRRRLLSAGPLDFSVTAKVAAVKERVVAEWPAPTPEFSKHAPEDPAVVKLIHNGKVLEAGKTLRESRIGTDGLVTCHLMIQTTLRRPPGKERLAKDEASDETAGMRVCCCCTNAPRRRRRLSRM